MIKMPNGRNSDYEYRTSFAIFPADFPVEGDLAAQLKELNPIPPKGDDWRLTNSVYADGVILFFWERLRRERRLNPEFGSDPVSNSSGM